VCVTRGDQLADRRPAVAIGTVAAIGRDRILDAPDYRFSTLIGTGTAITVSKRHICDAIHHCRASIANSWDEVIMV